MDITSSSRSGQKIVINFLSDPLVESNLAIFIYFLISYNRDWSDLKAYIVGWDSNTNITGLIYLEWENKTDLDTLYKEYWNGTELVEWSLKNDYDVGETIINNVFMVDIPLEAYSIPSGAEWFAVTAILNNNYPKSIRYYDFCPDKYNGIVFGIPISNGGRNEGLIITIIALSTIGAVCVVITIIVIRKVKSRKTIT